MLFELVKIGAASFIIIFVMHYLLTFFIETLTTPKIKDLINVPIHKYDTMFSAINHGGGGSLYHQQSQSQSPSSASAANDMSGSDHNGNMNMKTELKSFLKKQMTRPSDGNMNKISGFSSESSAFPSNIPVQNRVMSSASHSTQELGSANSVGSSPSSSNLISFSEYN